MIVSPEDVERQFVELEDLEDEGESESTPKTMRDLYDE